MVEPGGVEQTGKTPPEPPYDAIIESNSRRDRLLATLTLIAGIGLAISMPFALKAGAEFFLPTTAALVIAIALVPILEWLERHRVDRKSVV